MRSFLGLITLARTRSLVVLFLSLLFLQNLACNRELLVNSFHNFDKGISYRIPDSSEGLARSIELLTYRPLSELKLPIEVPVVFENCDGDVNAYYFGLTHTISVCYPLIDYFESIMEHDAAMAATMWVLGHELGHAVVGHLKLPVIRGEDVADSFAVWFSTEGQSVSAMLWFNARAMEDDTSDYTYDPMDEHSSAAVRQANVQCWLYGKTGNSAYLVSPWQRDCEGEWESINKFWSSALSSKLQP